MYSQVEALEYGQLRQLQDERLRTMISYITENIPFYQNMFERLGLPPNEIRSVDDLPKLPFTRKQDLKNHYPFGMLAVPDSLPRSEGGKLKRTLDLWQL